jgi:hypothetical protein
LRSCSCAMGTLDRGKRTSGRQCQGEKDYQAKSKAPAAFRRRHVGVYGLLRFQHEKVQPSVWPDVISGRDAPDLPAAMRATHVESKRKMLLGDRRGAEVRSCSILHICPYFRQGSRCCAPAALSVCPANSGRVSVHLRLSFTRVVLARLLQAEHCADCADKSRSRSAFAYRQLLYHRRETGHRYLALQ